MKRRVIWGIGILAVVFAIIAAFVFICPNQTDDAATWVDHPRPPPPPGPCPIEGDSVSLEEARRRTPYTIPVPPEDVVGAELKTICVSQDRGAEDFKRVYLIYTNELEIFIGGRPEFLDRSAHAKGPHRMTSVRGYPALGNDPYFKTFSDGHRNHIISSLNWWVNRVGFTLYHPTWLMADLVRVGEAMSDPVWNEN